MKKYILLAKTFEGFLSYEYNKLGYLVGFRNGSWSMTEPQQRGVLENIGYCFTMKLLHDFVKQHGYTIIEVEQDLSFERFYNAHEVMRNRLEALKLWSAIKTDEEKQFIFYNHEAFLRYCKRNTWYTRMYPDTYLRKHTRDEWDKIETAKK